MLKVLKLEDGGRYISPIIVLQFGLKIVLSISMNVDSNTSIVGDKPYLLLYCILLCV